MADGDSSKGNFIIGSPLAVALATRGITRYHLGRPRRRDDLRHSLAMARSADPLAEPEIGTVRRPSAVELTTAFISQHNQHSDLHRYNSQHS